MNLLKEFLELIPQRQTYYGQVVSLNADVLTVLLVGGGTLKIASSHYSQIFQQHDYVWLYQDTAGTWELREAPAFAQSYSDITV